jgi:zinc protease
VAGDCDPDDVMRQVESLFGNWRGDASAAPAPPGPVPVTARRERRVIMDREQSHVALGHLSVARSDPRLYALRALDVILGDGAGFASRLPTRLREVEGLAYIVECDSSSTAGLDPGIFWSYVATAPDQVGRVVEIIADEIERIRTAPPTDEERDVAVSFLLGHHLLDRESVESCAGRLIAIERYGLGLDYDSRYADIISSISAADVRRAASEVIRPDDLTLVVVGPRA